MSDKSFTTKKSLDHRIFRSDAKLSPTEINQLLGIKTNVPKDKKVTSREKRISACNSMLRIALVTLVLAALTLIGSMYQMKIGPFYDAEAIASSKG